MTKKAIGVFISLLAITAVAIPVFLITSETSSTSEPHLSQEDLEIIKKIKNNEIETATEETSGDLVTLTRKPSYLSYEGQQAMMNAYDRVMVLDLPFTHSYDGYYHLHFMIDETVEYKEVVKEKIKDAINDDMIPYSVKFGTPQPIEMSFMGFKNSP